MLNPASERLHLVEEVTGLNAPLGLSSGNTSVGLALTIIKDVMKVVPRLIALACNECVFYFY